MGTTSYNQLCNFAYTDGYKMTAPFFLITMRKPTISLTEYFTISSLFVRNSVFGSGGRFMNIEYESIVGEQEPVVN